MGKAKNNNELKVADQRKTDPKDFFFRCLGQTLKKKQVSYRQVIGSWFALGRRLVIS